MKGTRPAYTLETFMAKRVTITESGCWQVSGASPRYGYQVVGVAGKRYRAHRWTYEQVVGPIPDGLELDHLCRNTSCANPEHLEPVTHDENCRRRTFTECSRGHDLTLPGSRYTTKNRACKQCARERALASAARRRARRAEL